MDTEIITGHIYILFFPSGKRYVGQTIRNLRERMEEHWWPSRGEAKLPVNNAIRKYGTDNVKIENVLIMKCTQQYLDLIEAKAIVAFNTLAPNGYNLKGGGSHGKHNEESRAKMSLSKRGKPGTWIGRHHSEESKMKMSLQRVGRHRGPLSEEHKAKISLAKMGKPGGMTGKHHSEESKAKMRGKILSKETKAKISAAMKKIKEK